MVNLIEYLKGNSAVGIVPLSNRNFSIKVSNNVGSNLIGISSRKGLSGIGWSSLRHPLGLFDLLKEVIDESTK